MRLRLIAATVAIPLAVASLAGCGESALQKYAKTAPATIDKDARAAQIALKAVHMSGSVNNNGSKLAIDMSLDSHGKCVGSITSNGQKVSLISTGTGSPVYMQAGATFWEGVGGMPAATAAVFASKWVTGQQLASFAQICNLSQFSKSMQDTTIAQDKPTFAGTGKVNGIDVVKLDVLDKAGKKSTLLIDAAAPHNIIQVVGPASEGTMTFSAFNAPVAATAPAGAINIDTQAGSH